jgi:hypothetical protein
VGDKVDVPGDMHGVVKSIGPFAGVQLCIAQEELFAGAKPLWA